MYDVSLIRIYDENDEVDMEIVTNNPNLFSVVFSKPRQIHALSIEPGSVPLDASVKARDEHFARLAESAAAATLDRAVTSEPTPRRRRSGGRRTRP